MRVTTPENFVTTQANIISPSVYLYRDTTSTSSPYSTRPLNTSETSEGKDPISVSTASSSTVTSLSSSAPQAANPFDRFTKIKRREDAINEAIRALGIDLWNTFNPSLDKCEEFHRDIADYIVPRLSDNGVPFNKMALDRVINESKPKLIEYFKTKYYRTLTAKQIEKTTKEREIEEAIHTIVTELANFFKIREHRRAKFNKTIRNHILSKLASFNALPIKVALDKVICQVKEEFIDERILRTANDIFCEYLKSSDSKSFDSELFSILFRRLKTSLNIHLSKGKSLELTLDALTKEAKDSKCTIS